MHDQIVRNNYKNQHKQIELKWRKQMLIEKYRIKLAQRRESTILSTLVGFAPCKRGGDWVLGSMGGTIFGQVAHSSAL